MTSCLPHGAARSAVTGAGCGCVVDRVPGLGARAAHLRQRMVDSRLHTRVHPREHGEDLPEVAGWTWPG